MEDLMKWYEMIARIHCYGGGRSKVQKSIYSILTRCMGRRDGYKNNYTDWFICAEETREGQTLVMCRGRVGQGWKERGKRLEWGTGMSLYSSLRIPIFHIPQQWTIKIIRMHVCGRTLKIGQKQQKWAWLDYRCVSQPRWRVLGRTEPAYVTQGTIILLGFYKAKEKENCTQTGNSTFTCHRGMD